MLERLLARVIPEPNSGCWLWEGALCNGYGSVRFEGKSWFVHRLIYLLVRGPIDKGLHVLHRCDVASCCNPDHLFPGTNYDNIVDSMKKNRRKGITRNRPSGLRYHWIHKPGPKPKKVAM